MNQADSTKRKINKILENLSIELDSAGLAEKIQFKTSNDPWIDLQNAHSRIVGYIKSINEEQNKQLVKINEAVVLQCLKYFINIHVELANLSKMLSKGDYSLQIYKSYRKLNQQLSSASNCLYQFQSQNQQFLKQKEAVINQNIQVCQQIQNNHLPNANKESQIRSDNENDQNVIQSLKKQIQLLNDMIRQNDEEFTVQIQRYNSTLFELQQTVREYEIRMDKVRDYEAAIDDMEHKIIRLKQEKYRDDMLIDNMSKKIRFYQKERGGVDAFLSPRANLARKNVVSPGSRVFNQSMLNTNPNIIQPRQSKNYYGERLSSN